MYSLLCGSLEDIVYRALTGIGHWLRKVWNMFVMSRKETYRDQNLEGKVGGRDMCLYVHICLVCLEARNKGGMRMGDK